MFGKMLGGAKKSFGKVALMLSTAFVFAQNAFADGLEIPATAKTELIGYIENNFGVVIGIVIVVVGAGLIIKLIRKA